MYFAYRSQLPEHFVVLASLLGNLSYGTYLIHPFVSLFTNVVGLLNIGVGLSFAIYLAMVLIGAWVVYYGLEKPARRILRAKTRSISTLP